MAAPLAVVDGFPAGLPTGVDRNREPIGFAHDVHDGTTQFVDVLDTRSPDPATAVEWYA